ncbi:MAG TPA: AraC family transcriptional regulator [Bacteroidetes bacterium]|nr:AraC family transcriptional regulator [Bacteroidota bacterium]
MSIHSIKLIHFMNTREISNSNSNSSLLELVGKRLYIKFMVSMRCKLIVKSELEKLALNYKFSPHGAIEFLDGLSQEQQSILKNNLSKSGLILLSESESKLIDRIINTIVELIHYSDILPRVDYSEVISEHAILGEESILKIFSDVKGMSILQFIVVQKVERVKELMLYNDISLSEIAELLNYKNQFYLIAQFKKITGLTPSDYKNIKLERMKIVEKYKLDSRKMDSRSNTATG